MPVVIVGEECEGCGTCITICAKSAIFLKEAEMRIIAQIDAELCDECGECIGYCARGGIKKT